MFFINSKVVINLRGCTNVPVRYAFITCSTIYDSCKDWTLVNKIGNQIHTIFKERKIHYIVLLKKWLLQDTCSVQCLPQILWQNSSKIFVWSKVEEVATLLRMDSFRTIFKEKFTFTLKTHRTAFVITVKFPNLLKRYFSKLLLPLTTC